MNRNVANEYAPDYVSSPGETLQEILKERGMKQAELAERTGRPKKTINEIIQGKTAITAETALQLERALGVPASFWTNREASYRNYIAREEETRALSRCRHWLKQVPTAFMAKRGWIRDRGSDVDTLRELLSFFGVSSPSQWELMFKEQRARFRQSAAFPIVPGAVAAWLRQGEIEGHRINTAQFSKATFLKVLENVRSLTGQPPNVFEIALRDNCAEAGVAVVFVPAPKGCRACGATQWLSQYKALIQLSLRYKTDDHLWFTFFHEAAHILRHPKKAVFLEGLNSEGPEEDEANRFASDFLIPPPEYRGFVERADFTHRAIVTFARRLGIAPGIVVGRLQHDRLVPWNSTSNALKISFRWSDE